MSGLSASMSRKTTRWKDGGFEFVAVVLKEEGEGALEATALEGGGVVK